MSVDRRRRLVLDALLAVRRGRPLAGELRRLRDATAADGTAAAAEELLRGALQWQGRYDHVIARLSRRRATGDPVVRAVLHLALHQLLTSRGVPAYAAVHQAGELLRDAGRSRAVGYANALLQAVNRRCAAVPADEPLAAVADLFGRPDGCAPDDLAAWWSHPAWLVERWCARYGDRATAALLEHANTPAPITLHVLPGGDPGAARDALAALGWPAEPIAGYPRALRLSGRPDRADLRALLGAVPGLLVQDAGAQGAVDWLTGDGADLAAGEHASPVIDLCAAPGGKTAHLRALLPRTRLLVAVDLQPRRLALVRENRDRLGCEPLALVAGDGTRPPLRGGCCAAVLVDGPCSGTGVGRHHPEGRWRLRAATLRANGARLLDLAAAAADLLVAGGRLYYATCSLEREENEDVVAALLAQRGDLAPDPDPDGRYQRAWLPWREGTDAFFAARLRREDATR